MRQSQAQPVVSPSLLDALPKLLCGTVRNWRAFGRSNSLNDAFITLNKVLILGITCWLALVVTPTTAATFETERLIIRDANGNTSSVAFEKLVNLVDSTFAEVLDFWAADPRIDELGKIIVEFDRPLPNANASIFFWGKEDGKRVRVVRVFGGNEKPYQLAHKLTSAVFPNPDKLIRNMMGEASEMRFGNPLSFPMCGFDKDEWVMALLQAGSYISLTDIGPSHRDWGMDIVNNVPRVSNRVRQHISYLEAGSFGEFLISTYGTGKMKTFNRLSRDKPRPWQEVFEITLEQLEAGWLEGVRLRSRGKEGNISTLIGLRRNNPNTACSSAQALTIGKQ